MRNIAIIKTTDTDGIESIGPAEPFPADRIAVICDGEKYIVYQQGDELPPTPEQPAE
jgi:hypothetical protein